MLSWDRSIIFHQIFLLPIFHNLYSADSAEKVDPGINSPRLVIRIDANCLVTKTTVLLCFQLATASGLWWPTFTHAASCDALVGKWNRFIEFQVAIGIGFFKGAVQMLCPMRWLEVIDEGELPKEVRRG